MLGWARLVTTYLMATPSRQVKVTRRQMTTVSLASSSSSSSSNTNNKTSQGRKKKFQQTRKQEQEFQKRKSRRQDSHGGRRGTQQKQIAGNHQKQKKKTRTSPEVHSMPTLTSIEGPLPTFFSCRHGYEEVLMEEIERKMSTLTLSSPCPGLVQALPSSPAGGGDQDVSSKILSSMRPIYALQSIPNCHIIQADSIQKLALRALEVLQLDSNSDVSSPTSNILDHAQSLAIHGLVPGMFKGQSDPIWNRRVSTIANQVQDRLATRFVCARRRRQQTMDGNHDDATDKCDPDRWLLQLLLFSPEVMAVSLSKSVSPPDESFFLPWPNAKYPVGLPNVDIQTSMPSSAYRKLLEALECCSALPPHDREASPMFPVVDLGACPGGWTKALRLLGCRVLAVDRSPLRDDLMKDPLVEFISGDAFSFQPPWADQQADKEIPIANTWMVSDVIAYPERVAELLSEWCGNKWASQMIVTAKFQGSSIPWQALEEAEAVAKYNGYQCRIQHFFNNKHEVTVMLSYGQGEAPTKTDAIQERWKLLSQPLLGKPTYPAILGYSLALQ